ncbi:MAG: hypothetical protein PGN09_02575 [Sphingomonas fennica]
MTQATRALLRAITAGAGAEPQLLADRGRDWRSATFAGRRHALTLRLPYAAAERLAAAMADGTIAPRGHLIVEAGVTRAAGDPTLLTIAAMTVELA